MGLGASMASIRNPIVGSMLFDEKAADRVLTGCDLQTKP